MNADARALKLSIARSQLGTALDLFIRDKDPISVHALACGGCEIMEGLAESFGSRTMSTHILRTHPGIDRKKLKRLRNQHWNALKHFYSQDNKTIRDDFDLLDDFSDRHNDAQLFYGWYDYMMFVGRLPIPAQIFQVWWYATNEDKLTNETNLTDIRALFPKIGMLNRREQKRMLSRAVEEYTADKELLADPKTETTVLTAETIY